MATMNRKYSYYSERYESTLYKEYEWGLVLMPSCKLKQMRDKVVLTKIHGKSVD